VGVPQYKKSMETSWAATAAGIAFMVANANRRFNLENPGLYASGDLTACPATPGVCVKGATSACNLISCGYITNFPFSKMPYNYLAINPNTGSNRQLSRAVRSDSARYPCPTTALYYSWGYLCYTDGSCQAQGSAPRPP